MTPKGHLPYMTVGVNHQYNTIIIHATLISGNLNLFFHLYDGYESNCVSTHLLCHEYTKKRRNFRVYDTNNSLTFPRTLNQ